MEKGNICLCRDTKILGGLMQTLKIDTVFQLTRLIEALVLSGYTVTVKPIYKKELCIGGPHIDHFEVTQSKGDENNE